MLVVALSVAANQISQASRFSNLSTCDPANDDSAPELALWSHHPAVINALHNICLSRRPLALRPENHAFAVGSLDPA